MTGYGQDGPMAQAVGHDLNYIAQAGVLGMIGRRGQPPTPPLSLVGDFGGGGMLLALGILAALVERSRSGAGQVVDAAMVEGAALLATPFFGYLQTGAWNAERGTNIVDSGAPFYDAYECADGRCLTVAAMEPKFYARCSSCSASPTRPARPARPGALAGDEGALRRRHPHPHARRVVRAAEGVEACVAPVLGADEVAADPHLRRAQRSSANGIVQPAPAPRFSRTPAALSRRPPQPGEHTAEALADWGFDAEAIAALQSAARWARWSGA